MSLQEIANIMGFGSFKGMILYFLFLLCVFLLGVGIYYFQKPKK